MKAIEVARKEYSLQSGARPLTIVVKRGISGRSGYGFQIGFPKNLNIRTFNFQLPSSRYKQINKEGRISSRRTADKLCLSLADEVFALTDYLVQRPIKSVLKNKDIYQKQLMEIVDRYAEIFQENASIPAHTDRTTRAIHIDHPTGEKWLKGMQRKRTKLSGAYPSYIGRLSGMWVYQRELPRPIMRALGMPTSRASFRKRLCSDSIVLTARQCGIINAYTRNIDIELANTIDNMAGVTYEDLMETMDGFLEQMKKEVRACIPEAHTRKDAAVLHQDRDSIVQQEQKQDQGQFPDPDAHTPSPKPASSELVPPSFEIEEVMISLRGVETPCPECKGTGVKWYKTLSTWRRYPAKKQDVSDICDRCWGTGDLNNVGQSLLEDEQEIASLQAENQYLKELLSKETD